MSAPFLSLDLGNSRLKACTFADGSEAPLRSAAFPLHASGETARGALEALVAWLEDGPRPRAAALSSVADASLADRLALALEGCVEGPLARAPDPGLELAVGSPETVGLDRLYAARAALALAGRACVVVDVGTALTVDAVRPGGRDPGSVGTFLGGAIAPGPELLAAALAKGGARLPRFAARAGVPALGKDTHGALEAGVAVGLEGAALRLVEGISNESGVGSGPLFLTGGALEFVRAALEISHRALRVVPHLVPLGLREAAG